MIKFVVSDDETFAKDQIIWTLKAYETIDFDLEEHWENLALKINQPSFFNAVQDYLILHFKIDKKNVSQFDEQLKQLDENKNCYFFIDENTFKAHQELFNIEQIIFATKFTVNTKRKLFKQFLVESGFSKSLTDEQYETLLEVLPSEYSFFSLELQKLALLESTNFFQNAINAISNFDEVNVFQVVDAIFYHNQKQTLKLLEQNNDQSFLTKLFGLLVLQLYKLILYKQVIQKNLPLRNFFKSDFEIKKLRMLSALYDWNQVQKMNDQLSTIDYDVKNKNNFNLYDALIMMVLQWN